MYICLLLQNTIIQFRVTRTGSPTLRAPDNSAQTKFPRQKKAEDKINLDKTTPDEIALFDYVELLCDYVCLFLDNKQKVFYSTIFPVVLFYPECQCI